MKHDSILCVDYVNIVGQECCRCQHQNAMMVIVADKALQTGKKYHHGNLRAALIEASLRLIQEKGVRALTLREVASAVGVSRMAPYRHFSDRDELIWAISEAGFTLFGDALEAAMGAAAPDFAAQLDAMAVAYVRFAMQHPAYYDIMFGATAFAERIDRSSPAGERAFRILHQTIEAGQAAGEAREYDSMVMAQTLWSLVHGISTLRRQTDMSPEGAGTAFVLSCAELLKRGVLR